MARILLIEDDIELNKLIESILEQSGFEVHSAFNGIEGLKFFKEELYDVVITDILMPEKEGFETILEIKQHKKNAKIIAISGGGRYGMGEKLLYHARNFGADYVMKKPIVMKELVALCKELINIKN